MKVLLLSIIVFSPTLAHAACDAPVPIELARIALQSCTTASGDEYMNECPLNDSNKAILSKCHSLGSVKVVPEKKVIQPPKKVATTHIVTLPEITIVGYPYVAPKVVKRKAPKKPAPVYVLPEMIVEGTPPAVDCGTYSAITCDAWKVSSEMPEPIMSRELSEASIAQ